MLKAKKLTERQQQVFDLLKNHIDSTGMPPTRAEIAKELGFRSANAAEEHLKALARKGVIEIISGVSRGIRLVPNALELTEEATVILSDTGIDGEENGIPLIGRVAAGEPILAEEHIDNIYHIDPNMFSPSADFLLRVCGDSMKNIGILDGDLLAVHHTQDVRNGQVVVARIEDEVTVKRLIKQGSTIYLHAENDDFAPIVVDLTKNPTFEIEGVAVGVIRSNRWM